MSLPGVLPRAECETRLRLIFPREAFDAAMSSPIAAAGVAAMLYVGSVAPDHEPLTAASPVVRPSTCLWLQDDVIASHGDDESRARWFAASQQRRKLNELVSGWGLRFDPWYGDNSRETLRDETLHRLSDAGAVCVRRDIPTTSSAPRWALAESFAALFDPELTGEAFEAAADAWRANHLSTGAQVRLRVQRSRLSVLHGVEVTLPSGEVRRLAAGDASLILRGVVEQWAPNRLVDPVVLTISEPGDKVYMIDKAALDGLGVTIAVSDLLPDAIIADIGVDPVEFWVVEAVATDGPVTESRKTGLLAWATEQNIPPATMRFLSAFLSRGDPAAKRRLRDLAGDTLAWFLDEPGFELAWSAIEGAPLAEVIPL